jgi:hypothetical protein
MKQSELMIGNLLKGADGMLYRLESVQAQSQEPGEGVSLQPIELSDQWLLDLGFTKTSMSWGKSTEDFGLDLESAKTGGFQMVDGEGFCHSIPLLYVHQLQNLYFALTGEQLERSAS